MTGFRYRVSSRRKGQHRINQCIPKVRRNPLRNVPGDEIVFAQGHVRAVLLRAAGVNDCGVGAGRNRIAHLGPREILNKQRTGLCIRKGLKKKQ